jgi:putative spermidine/putrescine transport system ATP-binding protein
MQALEMVHLAGYAERMPRTLSGGQQQRVAIARSVAFRPPVLLMDESLSALDLKLRESLQGELKRLHREIGCTILFVTHDQGEALTLSDRIAVMRDGAILQVDTPQAVYDRPGHRFVAEFIGNTNILAIERGSEGDATIAGMQGRLGKLAEAFVSLRPEKLRRIAQDEDRTSFILGEGQVSQALFRGESVHYTLRLENGTSLDFRETRAAGRALLAIGDKITVGFRPQDVVPLADEQALETRAGKDETCVRK